MTRIGRNGLYPSIKPFNSGYLSVGDGHDIYYEECGNPNGLPVLYLHGGPGAGCDVNDRRFFDPKKCYILLFDQRGSGRSRPYANIYANTTRHLVDDIYKLLRNRGKDNVLLFGGSWGSTLALMFSITYPMMVSGMVLRGIFLSERAEVLDYLEGIPNTKFPEVWERFISQVPRDARHNPAEYYFAQMISGDSKLRKRFAFEWNFYESARLTIELPDSRQLSKDIFSEPYLSLAIMEAHYIKNLCFIEEGYILKNVRNMLRVPVSIIHGRFDDLCPVNNALRLHRALPGSALHLVVGGHSRRDPAVQEKLVSETERIVKLLSSKL